MDPPGDVSDKQQFPEDRSGDLDIESEGLDGYPAELAWVRWLQLNGREIVPANASAVARGCIPSAVWCAPGTLC